jgi:hypothetical protein
MVEKLEEPPEEDVNRKLPQGVQRILMSSHPCLEPYCAPNPDPPVAIVIVVVGLPSLQELGVE